MALVVVVRALSAAIVVYMLACSLRIFLTWAPGLDAGAAGRFLARAVDPYLLWFRRFRFLSSGRFDFSPIAAIAVLAVLDNVLATLAFSGRISVGLVLGMLLGAVWSALGFLLSFLAVCSGLRIVAYAARWNSLHPLWRTLDELLNPVLYRIKRVVYRNRIVNYMQGLVTGFLVLAVLRIGGGKLVSLVVGLLSRLPF